MSKNKKKEVKKRGRKPKSSSEEEITQVTEENENIILHLPIQPSDVGIDVENTNTEKKKDMTTSIRIDDDLSTEVSDPTESEKDDCLKCNNCHKKEKKIKELKATIDKLVTTAKTNSIPTKSRKVMQLKVDFVDIHDGESKWKEKTDIACWWCTYNFDTMPCAIPEKFYKNKFYVFGCFCSYNCAVAYNLDINDYKLWERYSLIKLLYYKITGEHVNIMPAPPRQSLKKFGGNTDIKQFRNNSQSLDKEYRLIMPPMISIVPLIEEDYRDKNTIPSKNAKPIAINSIAVMKATENLKIKRSKPLINSKFSLEESMGIKRKTARADS